MNIHVGKYVITSDSLNIILNERKVVKDGKRKGEEYLVPIGYYGTIEGCMEALLRYKVRKSQATSIKGLIEDVNEISKFIKKQFKEARVGK